NGSSVVFSSRNPSDEMRHSRSSPSFKDAQSAGSIWRMLSLRNALSRRGIPVWQNLAKAGEASLMNGCTQQGFAFESCDETEEQSLSNRRLFGRRACNVRCARREGASL